MSSKKEEVLALYEKGLTKAEIAKETNLELNTVQKYTKGLPDRGSDQKVRQPFQLTVSEMVQDYRLVLNGMSKTAFAEKFGISVQKLHRIENATANLSLDETDDLLRGMGYTLTLGVKK